MTVRTTKKIEKHSAPSLLDGIKKSQELSDIKKCNFIESIDVAINLGIDAKQSGQSVKGSVLLPNGSGKNPRIIVFTADSGQKKLAIDTGATMAGLEDLIMQIDGGFLDFDVCIATPDAMQKLGKVAKKLGTRGLMPSPKNGTVTNNIEKAISDSMKGKVNFKNDKSGIIHCLAGKINFDTKSLLENVEAIIVAVKASKPEGVKGKFIQKFYLNTTMGRSIQVATESL